MGISVPRVERLQDLWNLRQVCRVDYSLLKNLLPNKSHLPCKGHI